MLDPVVLTKRFVVVLEENVDELFTKHIAPLVNRSIETRNFDNIILIVTALDAALLCFKYKKLLEKNSVPEQLSQYPGFYLIYSYYKTNNNMSFFLKLVETHLRDFPAVRLFSTTTDEYSALKNIANLSVGTNSLLFVAANDSQSIMSIYKDISPLMIDVERDKFNFQSDYGKFFRDNLKRLFATVADGLINNILKLPEKCEKQILNERILNATILSIRAAMHKINNFNRPSDRDFNCAVITQSIIRAYIDHGISETKGRQQLFLELLVAIEQGSCKRFTKFEKEQLLTIAFKTSDEDIVPDYLGAVFQTLGAEDNSFKPEEFYKTCQTMLSFDAAQDNDALESAFKKLEKAIASKKLSGIDGLLQEYYNLRPRKQDGATDYSKTDYFINIIVIAKKQTTYKQILKKLQIIFDQQILDIITEYETQEAKEIFLNSLNNRSGLFSNKNSVTYRALMDLYLACVTTTQLIDSLEVNDEQASINENGALLIDQDLIEQNFHTIISKILEESGNNKTQIATKLINAAASKITQKKMGNYDEIDQNMIIEEEPANAINNFTPIQLTRCLIDAAIACEIGLDGNSIHKNAQKFLQPEMQSLARNTVDQIRFEHDR